jgi:hypothetical protein
VGTQPAGRRFFSGKRAASRDRKAESVEAEPGTGVHLVEGATPRRITPTTTPCDSMRSGVRSG